MIYVLREYPHVILFAFVLGLWVGRALALRLLTPHYQCGMHHRACDSCPSANTMAIFEACARREITPARAAQLLAEGRP